MLALIAIYTTWQNLLLPRSNFATLILCDRSYLISLSAAYVNEPPKQGISTESLWTVLDVLADRPTRAGYRVT